MKGLFYIIIASAVVIAVFFLWQKIFNRIIANKTAATTASSVTAIATPVAVVALFLFVLYVAANSYPKRSFNREKWATSPAKRYEFSESIIQSKLSIGKTKPEIIQILGPDKSATERSDVWQYHIGYKPTYLFLGMQEPILEIYFEDGRVIEVSQYEGEYDG